MPRLSFLFLFFFFFSARCDTFNDTQALLVLMPIDTWFTRDVSWGRLIFSAATLHLLSHPRHFVHFAQIARWTMTLLNF